MKRQQKKFEKPLRPRDRTRMETDRKLKMDYGLRRKKEIFRAESILRNIRRQARELEANRNKEKEAILMNKLNKLGLLPPNANLDDVLSLEIENILQRRLQTLVVKRGIAKTPRQARQFIVHGHIALEGRRIRWPSVLIEVEKESKIKLYEKSPIKFEEKVKSEGNAGETA